MEVYNDDDGRACTPTTTQDQHREKILKTLYNETLKKGGGDLEVQCPRPHDDKQLETIRIHSCIASACSEYFKTFPDNATRVIPEIDSIIFRRCVKFMYLGEIQVCHDTVASLLAAAQLLLMAGLSQHCSSYLEGNLDHSNWETVASLADTFQIPDLKAAALRFSRPNQARDAMQKKKVSYVKEMQEAEREQSYVLLKIRSMKKKLETIQEQWNDMAQNDLDAAIEAANKTRENATNNEATILFPKETFKESGGVGRFVHNPRYDYDKRFVKYSPLDEKAKESQSESDEDEDDEYSDDSSSSCSFTHFTKKLRAPSKEDFEEKDILYSYGYICNAIRDSNPGDTIWLSPGIHDMSRFFGNVIRIKHSLDIVGRGKGVIIRCDDTPFFVVEGGHVRFSNITFKFSGGNGPSSEMMLVLEGGQINQPEGRLFVYDCSFDMGSDVKKSVTNRMSGINLGRGLSAVVKDCHFTGGRGAAITVINDPHLKINQVEILGNTFVHTGQPHPAWDDRPVPGPAALELWKLFRKCYRLRDIQGRPTETYSTTQIRIEGNHFSQNLRAPFCHRSLMSEEHPPPTGQFENGAKLVEMSESDADIAELAPGYEITMKSNTMEDNGIGMDDGNLSQWLGSLKRKHGEDAPKLPDGETLLSVKEVIPYSCYGDSKLGFPPGFQDGQPEQDFAYENAYNSSEEDTNNPFLSGWYEGDY